jgi:riboflavin kinase/FMN adenylyltransferase
VVVRGAARGRAIGYPTANLSVDTDLRPKPGIYAARARLLADEGDAAAAAPAAAPAGAVEPAEPGAISGALAAGMSWTAALSVGTNPTFASDGSVTIEAHLLDFSGDLYGRRLRLELVSRLRDERRFESVEALVAQIADDVALTRTIVGQSPQKA